MADTDGAIDIRVRPGTRGDIEALAAWNAALAWETENRRLDPDTVRAGVAAVFERPGRGRYLVAERGGERAGCLLLTFEWSDWRNGDWWWIQSVYVDAAHRRRGVFEALYRHVESEAAATPEVCGLRLYVEYENTRAQRTYERLGMTRSHYHHYERALR